MLGCFPLAMSDQTTRRFTNLLQTITLALSILIFPTAASITQAAHTQATIPGLPASSQAGLDGYTAALGAAPACNIYSARIVTDAGETYISDLIDAFNT
jgi:hypothetical protein